MYLKDCALTLYACRKLRQPLPQGFSVDRVVNANAGLSLTARECEIHNTLSILRGRMKGYPLSGRAPMTAAEAVDALRRSPHSSNARRHMCTRWLRRIRKE